MLVLPCRAMTLPLAGRVAIGNTSAAPGAGNGTIEGGIDADPWELNGGAGRAVKIRAAARAGHHQSITP